MLLYIVAKIRNFAEFYMTKEKMIEILGRDYYCFDFKPTDFKDVNEELKHKMKEKNNEQVQR